MKRNYKQRISWALENECLLLEHWAARQSRMRATSRKGHIYSEIAVEMRKQGAAFTTSEIKYKVRNLTTKYRSEKIRMREEGELPSEAEWPHFLKMHEILGSDEIIEDDDPIDDTMNALTSSPWRDELCPPSPSLLRPMSPTRSLSSRPSTSPSPPPTPNGKPLREAAKKKKSDFQTKLLQSLEHLESEAAATNDEMRKATEAFQTSHDEMMTLMKSYIDDAKEVNVELIKYLRRH